MIALVIELECDGCSKRQASRCDGLMGMPHIPTLLAAYGWGQFLTGPVLCPECCQSEAMIERVTRLFTTALNIGTAHRAEQLAQRGRAEGQLIGAIRTGKARPGPKKKFSDEAIRQAVEAARGNRALAARTLGMNYQTLAHRVQMMKVAQNGQGNGNLAA